MGYGILRGQKIKLGGVKGMAIHVEREKRSRSNPDINYENTQNNYAIIEMGDLNKKVANRVAELPGQKTKTGKVRKIQDNAVMMYDFIITGTHEDIMAMSVEQRKKYFEDAVDFIAELYGRENIMYAVVHNDERTPHLHLGLVPEYKGKLAAYKLFTPASMRDLQDLFYCRVSSKYDLERGRMTGRLTEGDNSRKHKTAVELKSETYAEVNQIKQELVRVRKAYQECKKDLANVKSETDKERKELENIRNRIFLEQENLRFLSNLTKICDDDEKKLQIIADIIKQSDSESRLELKYNDDGNVAFDVAGKPIYERVGGAFGDLTAQKLAQLVMPERNEDSGEWQYLSETEKDEKKADQAFDIY